MPVPGSAARQIEWLATAPNNAHMYGPPAISSDGLLYEGAYDHKVYAFPQTTQPVPIALGGDTSTGPADRFIGGALVDDTTQYIGMGDKGVIAYNRVGGWVRWTFTDTQYGR